MGAIKRNDDEQQFSQESPSKEIIKALAFVVVCVLIAAIYYNAYLFWITEYEPIELPPLYQVFCFAIAIAIQIAILIVILIGECDN